MKDTLSALKKFGIHRISFIILAGIVVFLAVGSFLLPEIFWDGFLWKYFAGPVYADAEGESVDGISEGYNPVNTLVYGLILAGSVYLIYELLTRKRIQVDERFVFAMIPFILLGSILRVLEDAEFFPTPIQYLMISPLIYLLIGLFTIGMVMVSIIFESNLKIGNTDKRKIDIMIILTLSIIFVGYGFVYYHYQQGFDSIGQPLSLAVIGIIIAKLSWYIIRKRITRVHNMTGSGFIGYDVYLGLVGWSLSIIALLHLFWWGWYHGEEFHLRVIPGILAMTVSAWVLMILFLNHLNRKFDLKISTHPMGLNSLMIFSQFLDGAATFTGLDFYGYREKHVLPSFLIDITGTAGVMFILKFLVLLLAFYLLDVEYRTEMKDHPRLCGLIKLVVIVLGLAPGTRDMLRLALGI